MILPRCRLLGALLLTAVALISTAPASAARHRKHAAQETAPAQTLGEAAAWTAYASRNKTGRVCYLVGKPQKSEPAGFVRKSVMAMVTHRPSEHIANVVSFVEGYRLKKDSEVTLEIDGRKFELFTEGDGAWARTSELDRTIVDALMRGRQAVAKGRPRKGPRTTDFYSLAGFTKALAMIDKACGIKRGTASAPASHRASKHLRKRHHR